MGDKMKTVTGLKIMLEYGHFITVGVSEEDSRNILRDWYTERYLQDGITKLKGECTASGARWVVKVSSIVGIHTCEIQVQNNIPGSPWGGSGYKPPMFSDR
jgi:hypothetical protein